VLIKNGIDKRFFERHTGLFLVKFFDPDRLEIQAEVGGTNWYLLDFVLMAYNAITGQDRTKNNYYEEAKNWQILRIFCYDQEGVVEVKTKFGI